MEHAWQRRNMNHWEGSSVHKLIITVLSFGSSRCGIFDRFRANVVLAFRQAELSKLFERYIILSNDSSGGGTTGVFLRIPFGIFEVIRLLLWWVDSFSDMSSHDVVWKLHVMHCLYALECNLFEEWIKVICPILCWYNHTAIMCSYKLCMVNF